MCLFHPPCASGLKVLLQMARQGLPGKPPSVQNEWEELACHHPPLPHVNRGWWARHTFLWAPVLSSRRLTRSWVGGAGGALAGGQIRPESPVGRHQGTL